MAKRIRRDYDIYLAPRIRGYYEHDSPMVLDEKSNRYLDPYDIDSKVIIYERQVKEWFLNRATRYLRGDNGGFVVLMICISYLEGIQQYRQGESSRNRSSEFFRNSIHRLYSNQFSDNQINQLYSQARCGLFHNGMVDGKVIINSEFENSIEFPDSETIRINQRILLNDIKKDLNDYVNVLKDTEQIEFRQNFDQMFTNL